LAAQFEPNRHVHLEGGKEKEMLPWVKLAVEMDPHNVDAYTVGGYWLRQLGKPAEAEAFLREGQRNNPDSYEIYFELGRLVEIDRQNPGRALRLYELALEKWKTANAGLPQTDLLGLAQILGRLGQVNEGQGNLEAALHYYKLLKGVSHNPDGVQRLIDDVQERLARGGGTT
jgi:tetratricopeptide (TPR) repeat protein